MISVASRLIGREGITAVHVISTQRPSYDEVLSYRRWANARDLQFKIDVSSVSFRSHRQPEFGDGTERVTGEGLTHLSYVSPRALVATLHHLFAEWPAAAVNTISPCLDRLRLQARSLQAELNAMSEGTR